jgi:hypothetical protein
MNSETAAGLALTVLGLAGVFSTGAPTAAIPAVFGLLLFGLGAMARRSSAASWAAAGVGLLGVIAPLANIARAIGQGGLVMGAATFSNGAMAVICGLYLALKAWEGRGGTGRPVP